MRKIGCLGSVVVAAIVAYGVTSLIPSLPAQHDVETGNLVVRGIVGFLVFWAVGMVLSKVLSRLLPTPAETAQREADRAMKAAPLATTAAASVGQYLRVRGRLEPIDGVTIEASVTGRACLAYVVRRIGHGPRGASGRSGTSDRTRQRGVRARLVDGSGEIALALDGQDWTPTGDAMADGIMERAASTMTALGDDPRLFPSITFRGAEARVQSDATDARDWPASAAPPSAERLDAVDTRDFPRARKSVASLGEQVLEAGAEVEAVGLVVSRGGVLVLDGPANGKLIVNAV